MNIIRRKQAGNGNGDGLFKRKSLSKTQSPVVGGRFYGADEKDEAVNRLQMTVGNVINSTTYPELKLNDETGARVANTDNLITLSESDPMARRFIEDELFANVGMPDADATKVPWSAATTSALVRGFMGVEDNEQAKSNGFRPSPSHATYIGDAFKTRDNNDYEYNFYQAERLNRNTRGNLQPGDVLFVGRGSSSNWGFDKFKRKAGESYPSHTDIIVSTGKDANGRVWYDLAGGNVSDKFATRRVYADDIDSRYVGAMIAAPNRFDFYTKGKPTSSLLEYFDKTPYSKGN